VAKSAVASDLLKPAYIELNLPLEVSLHAILSLNDLPETAAFGFRKFAYSGLGADAGGRHDLPGAGQSHSIDVRQRVLHFFVSGQIYPRNSCQITPPE
jgi:hypothetical protein